METFKSLLNFLIDFIIGLVLFFAVIHNLWLLPILCFLYVGYLLNHRELTTGQKL